MTGSSCHNSSEEADNAPSCTRELLTDLSYQMFLGGSPPMSRPSCIPHPLPHQCLAGCTLTKQYSFANQVQLFANSLILHTPAPALGFSQSDHPDELTEFRLFTRLVTSVSSKISVRSEIRLESHSNANPASFATMHVHGP